MAKNQPTGSEGSEQPPCLQQGTIVIALVVVAVVVVLYLVFGRNMG